MCLVECGFDLIKTNSYWRCGTLIVSVRGKSPQLLKVCVIKQINRMHKRTYLYLHNTAADESKHMHTYGPNKV